ncbi:hypothetical protein TKK_0011504 [Trichogramma kaykai]
MDVNKLHLGQELRVSLILRQAVDCRGKIVCMTSKYCVLFFQGLHCPVDPFVVLIMLLIAPAHVTKEVNDINAMSNVVNLVQSHAFGVQSILGIGLGTALAVHVLRISDRGVRCKQGRIFKTSPTILFR